MPQSGSTNNKPSTGLNYRLWGEVKAKVGATHSPLCQRIRTLHELCFLNSQQLFGQLQCNKDHRLPEKLNDKYKTSSKIAASYFLHGFYWFDNNSDFLTICAYQQQSQCGGAVPTKLKVGCCCCCYPTPSEGWGHGGNHGAPEAGQLPRAWTKGRRKTESCQRASGAKSL